MRIFITQETVTWLIMFLLYVHQTSSKKNTSFFLFCCCSALNTQFKNFPLFCILFSCMASMRRDLFYKTLNYIFLCCIYHINTANDHCCSGEWNPSAEIILSAFAVTRVCSSSSDIQPQWGQSNSHMTSSYFLHSGVE